MGKLFKCDLKCSPPDVAHVEFVTVVCLFIKVVGNKESKFFSHRYLIEFNETNRMSHVPHL